MQKTCSSAGEAWGWLQLIDSMSYAKVQHLNIIQHPQGRRKEIAVQHNEISGVFPNVIHYTTDTEPGSSGSPVFNNAWDLISIHHAAGHRAPDYSWPNNPNYMDNEGMRIDKIVADLRSHYGGSATGAQILAELGI